MASLAIRPAQATPRENVKFGVHPSELHEYGKIERCKYFSRAFDGNAPAYLLGVTKDEFYLALERRNVPDVCKRQLEELKAMEWGPSYTKMWRTHGIVAEGVDMEASSVHMDASGVGLCRHEEEIARFASGEKSLHFYLTWFHYVQLDDGKFNCWWACSAQKTDANLQYYDEQMKIWCGIGAVVGSAVGLGVAMFASAGVAVGVFGLCAGCVCGGGAGWKRISSEFAEEQQRAVQDHTGGHAGRNMLEANMITETAEHDFFVVNF